MSNTRKPSAQGPNTSADKTGSETTDQAFSAKPSIIEAEPLEATRDQLDPMTDRQRDHLLLIRAGEARGDEIDELYHECALEVVDEEHERSRAHTYDRESDYCNDEHDHEDDHDHDDFDESAYLAKVNALLHELYPTATQQSLDLEGVTPEPLYHDHLHKHYTTSTLAPALLTTDPVEYSEVYKRLSQCADNVSIVNGKVYHHSRCNLRICPLCSAIKARKLAHKLKRIIRSDEATFRLAASDNNPLQAHKRRVHAICLGLNLGKRCHLHQIQDYVQALNSTWQSFYKSKPVDRFVEGFYRVTEAALEPSGETLNAHTHIHATIFVDASEGGLTLEEALSYAKDTLIPIWVNRARKTIKKLKLDTTIMVSGQEVFPLKAQNRGELGGWLTYCTKGVVAHEAEKLRKEKGLSVGQHADAWIALGNQLKHQRLVSDGGIFKESRQAYERAEELKKLDRVTEEAIDDELHEQSALPRARRKRDERPPRVTHIWSHACSRWKKVEEYDHDLDCSPESFLRGFQLRQDRETAFAIIQEMKDHQRRVIDQDLITNAEDKEAENRWRMAYWVATGKAPPKHPKSRAKEPTS